MGASVSGTPWCNQRQNTDARRIKAFDLLTTKEAPAWQITAIAWHADQSKALLITPVFVSPKGFQ
jgi:hypothetical protein